MGASKILLNSLAKQRTAQLIRASKITPVIGRCLYQQTSSNEDYSKNRRLGFKLYTAAVAAGVIGAASSYLFEGKAQALQQKKITTYNDKVYSRKEVSQHDSREKGVWVTYKGKVYDITEFIDHHPGGSGIIMMGAGGDVGPFWQTYTVHEAAEVQKLLSKYEIGVLDPSEVEQVQQTEDSTSKGPYADDPVRNPLLLVHSKQPFNAETPCKLLTTAVHTPTEIFFVRNHLPVPEVNPDEYTLSLCSGTDRDVDNLKVIAEFTLHDLKTKFKPYTIDCVIQCSGNRRSDLKKLKEIKGLDWSVGAMGNASWTGVRLVDLLDSVGIKPSDSVKHVQMEGLDCDMSGQSYNASISADVAFDSRRDVLLAYEMNGQPLSRDHGFPIRFVAPGITGARNVKWLSKIILSHEESNGHWQRYDYKSFSPNVDMFNIDYTTAVSIQEMPVQSAICDPCEGDVVTLSRSTSTHADQLTIPIKGYAYSGGGKMIVRVDVSTDGGQTWQTAKLDNIARQTDGKPDYTERNRVWGWTRWSLSLAVPQQVLAAGGGRVEVLCRAFDASYNTQPERAETVWNVRGVVNNSWHKVNFEVKLK